MWVSILNEKKISLWKIMMKIGKKMGCHQKSERSFFYKNYQFFLCARCTGILIGSFSALLISLFYINIFLNIIFMFIMILDGSIQYLNIYKSTNIRRLITGLLAGYGLVSTMIYVFLMIINIYNC